MSQDRLSSSRRLSRRRALQGSVAAAAAAGALPRAAAAPVHNQHQEVLRVGLVGCGGRGTGAAVNALRADPNAQLVALGDAFGDMLERSLQSLLAQADIAPRVQVDENHRFLGFDAYRRVVDSVDVVLLATSPHFRPEHMRYAVEQGRHLFVEKPVAVDARGVRSVMESGAKAAEKGLCVVSGLCYRYQFAKQETIRRIHDGAIGEPVALQCSYNTGGLWHRGDKPEWSRMEYMMRNWLYFTWLSGDHIAEQHIHSLDKLLWAMGDVPPLRATASGGRIARTDPKYGNVYDHFNTVFEWENGVRGFSSCRQIPGAAADVSDWVFGTRGVAGIQHHTIRNEEGRWRYRGEGPDDMYQNEHDALFAAIRSGEPINNTDYMCKSTLMAILGRMAAYTGRTLSWDEVWNSELDLSPPAYDWIDFEPDPVAVPGVTPFV